MSAALETQITDWLRDREADMIALLEAMVNTDSGSYDKPGVDAAGDVLQGFYEREGIQVDTIPIETHGDALRATVAAPGATGNRPILLMGHRDTVFSKGEAGKRPFKIENGRAYGPGVADMKAGLVMNAFLLVAFSKFGGAPAPLVALITGDEEIGSPTSRPHIEAEASTACAVFNSEPGRPTGNIVTGRKGGIFLRCDVTGKAAHSGANFGDGISAIEELARKIQAWHALTDIGNGRTVNVGLIEGGQSVNTVAPSASCQIDVRYVEPADRDQIVGAITAIAENANVVGTSAVLSIVGEFRPMKQSDAAKDLFDQYTGNAKDAGLSIAGEFSGGCADSGFAAAVGAPTLCGVGPVGGKVHSPDEYLEVASIVPRAQAIALTILRFNSPI